MTSLSADSVDVDAVIRAHAAQGFRSCSGADEALAALGAEVERLREALGKIANGAELQLGFVAQRRIAREALDG